MLNTQEIKKMTLKENEIKLTKYVILKKFKLDI